MDSNDSSETFSTRRPTVNAIEELLHVKHKVLDHGFVRVVDYMGDDDAIVQAARVSYGRGTKTKREDRGLIRYLMRHRHTTPFEMCELKLHIKLPIFVARQWIRHRTANVNEYSGRYSILDKEFYIPEADTLRSQSSTNKQGRGDAVGVEEAQRALQILRDDSERSYANYLLLLNEDVAHKPIDEDQAGLSRELARIGLGLNMYTQWYWKIDLHNLLHFLLLRADRHAQYEIRAYAEVILKIVHQWVPSAYDAFLEYRLNAVELSSTAVAALKSVLQGESVTAQSSGLSASEWDELRKAFDMK